jgi:hypothetical protein
MKTFEWLVDRANLILKFDPEYDITLQMPFNSGVFASHCNAIDKEQMFTDFERASAFQAPPIDPKPLISSRDTLFKVDQGFLKWFVTGRRMTVTRLDDLWVRDKARFAKEIDNV